MIMRSEIEGTKAFNLITMGGFRLGVNIDGPAAQVALDPDSPPIQVLTPTVAIDVLLPDETDATSKGLVFLIYNDAAAASGFTLSVKENDDTTAVDTLAEQTGAVFFCDGTQWLAVRGSAT